MTDRGTEEKTTEASPEGLSDAAFIEVLWHAAVLSMMLLPPEGGNSEIRKSYEQHVELATVERFRRKRADSSLNTIKAL